MFIIRYVNQYLTGWPETGLTVGLLLIAAFAVWTALAGSPARKAITLAWMVAP